MIVRENKGQKDFSFRSLALCSDYYKLVFECAEPVDSYVFSMHVYLQCASTVC